MRLYTTTGPRYGATFANGRRVQASPPGTLPENRNSLFDFSVPKKAPRIFYHPRNYPRFPAWRVTHSCAVALSMRDARARVFA
jgi:hypothetical protein